MMLKESAPKFQKRNWRPLIDSGVPAQIRLWQVDLDLAPPDVTALSLDERERAATFRFPVHRQRFIACRAALRNILAQESGCLAEQIEFSYSPTGKPSCDFAHFNVAHSENVGLIAVGPSTVGIDIELKRPAEFELLARNVFSPAEMEVWSALSPSQKPESFYSLWTRKEALLKAIGCGITEHTQDVSVFFGNGAGLEVPASISEKKWNIRSFKLNQNYAAAVAWMAT